jgi:parallel beta-helix repeat protein
MWRLQSVLIVGILSLSLQPPLFAQYSGTYDIGGSTPDFSSIVNAANLIRANGVSGPVICNIHSGTFWEGQVHLNNIPGLSVVHTLTFQNAPGESPVVRAPYFNVNVFKIDSANYITIQGLDIRDCEETAIRIVGSVTDSCKQIRIINNYIHNIGTYAYTDASAILCSYSADCEIIQNRIDGDAVGIMSYHSRRNLVANNMVYSCASGINPGIPGCIVSYYSDNLLIYHNSCQSSGVPILYLDNSSNLAVRDNIFYQAASGTYYAIQIYSAPGLICDYNDLYAPSGYVGYVVYGYQTLADWQAATPYDDHSISADPNFLSSTNLHVSEPSPVGFAGTTVPEITTDYDGQTRKIPNPDIGADEFLLRLAGSYDVGGGANHYATPVTAANRAVLVGVSGAVTFNIYSGTYNGQVNLPAIYGTSATNTVTFQAAYMQSPIITNTIGTTQTDGNGFYLTGADYVTIQNLQITNTAAHGIFNSFTGSDSSSYNYFCGNYIHDVGTLGDYSGITLLNSPNCKVLRNKIESDYYGIQLTTSKRDTVANNMVYFAGLTGIYENGGTDNRYFYNSVYQEMNPSTTYNFYIYHGTNITLKDNVLYHSGGGTHYALSITGDLMTYPLTSDYNDFYAPSAYVGYYNGNRTTLVNWQTATGQDAHSLSADPSFLSLGTPDLHINPTSPVEMEGIAIAGITEDFDGESRPSVNPDMGADEVSMALVGEFDVGGGNWDFPDPVSAANYIAFTSIGGPVVFNIYSGTYNGEILIGGADLGSSPTNTLTFQNAPGQSPVITSTTGRGFYLSNSDYVIIQGLEIANCAYEGFRIVGTLTDSVTHISAIGNYLHDVGTGTGLLIQYGADCQILGNEISGGSVGLTNGIFCRNGSRNLIANNMVYLSYTAGINNNLGTNDQIYFNSILMNNGSALRVSYSNNVMVKNNILCQRGSGDDSAILITHNLSTYPVLSDYNDLYAPDNYVGTYLSTSYSTLADWRAATSLDQNSISADPSFVSIAFPYNLHVVPPSPVDGTGIPIVGITTDFDGDIRNATTPDIGADEFGVAGPPEAVDDLIITLSSSTDDSTNITLIWSPAENAVQYHIYKSSEPYSGFGLIGSTSDTTYTDTSVIVEQSKSFYYVTSDNQ